jgi:hypothetical protein
MASYIINAFILLLTLRNQVNKSKPQSVSQHESKDSRQLGRTEENFAKDN